jgi:signal transduction histidine kinase
VSVCRTVEDHAASFAEAGLEVGVSVPERAVWVDADPTRIAQAVGNLLGNALKFTSRGGHIAVAVEEEDGHAVVRVEDDGVGMSPEILGRIFTPFAQADRTLDRSRGGLGLGLAMVRGMIELHGGTVSAVSEGPGKGSTLTLRLPLRVAGEGRAALIAKPAAN